MENRIVSDLKNSYGLTCNQITPVTGGWLNLKWKVSTDKGELLVKQYSNRRFNRNQLDAIESALQRQIILEKNGVRCPFIWQCADRAIRLLDDETAYMVMDFRPGKMESAETITVTQMRSLGRACALIHKAFSELPVLSVKGFPIHGEQMTESLWNNYYARMRECPSDAAVEYREAVLAQEPILKQITSRFFDKLPKGIAHEDFTFDNVLFDREGVSAVIDFDRNCYSYIWHDIGRAILCFALDDDKMDIGKIYAFLEGYSEHLPLTLADIADALRISWCIEVLWWIQPEYFGKPQGKASRFRDEILWLTRHWDEIDGLLYSRPFYCREGGNQV